MPARYTLGIEEEFQMVDCQTGHLSPQILTVLEKGASLFGDKIKPEMVQSAVEIVTDVCPDITVARLELQNLRKMLLQLLQEEGLTIISAGTHPQASWLDQPSTPNDRYIELEEELQDVVRSVLIFGLHVHVGVENHEIAIALMNQLRTWIPHLLAISTNSPFWEGRLTGIKSYRSVIWRPLPRSGVSEPYISWGEFASYVQSLVEAGIIDNGKKIWWDVRPHAFFPTVEFRVCDMPATIEDTLAIAALCQALVAKLSWLYKRGMATLVLPRYHIDENKWRAMRYGLDAEIIDFVQNRRLSMRAAIGELLEFIDDVLDDLGSHTEIQYLRALLEDSSGTGADRQIAIYEQTGSVDAVTRYLMQQTLKGMIFPSTSPI
jgi:glutamate---cysteine ligase / carboxylate-amine ligase